ncbi:MAG: sulfur carrier protein ThiS adenylyltransferase ThiF [Lentisphaerae bacterium]|nr:sulfur carrier protein ThiS adenylyltransferase ThiF [Lentisphaerota bacterium]
MNERPLAVEDGLTLLGLRDREKPDADVVTLNGGLPAGDSVLREGDSVCLIRRGEIPDPAELDALMAARHTPGVHRRLAQASVGIAGLGGLGSAVAVALARVGIGRLVLADFDVVEPSNLNRQQYFTDQIGMRKTEALAANLARIHPRVRCETHAVRLVPDNLASVFATVDVLVEAFDRADQKVMLLQAFAAARPDIPIVGASGLAGHGDESGLAVRRLGPNLYIVGDLETAARPGCGLMAPRVGIAAHMQANVVLRLLVDGADRGGRT